MLTIMAAGHRKTDNLLAILDHNHLQIDGVVDEIKNEEPVAEKLEAFGWAVHHIDGHDYDAILAALEAARDTKGQPTFIVAETVKGKGVSFMENNVDFHGKAASDEELKVGLAELDLALAQLGGAA